MSLINTEIEIAKGFCNQLLTHAKRKAALYDGVKTANREGNQTSVDFFLRCATEELGEVASAITRERWALAKEECIDLAHTAMLIYMTIERNQ